MSSDNAHIEMVTLKIGLAETDEQLENIIIKFLAPILQKLNSNDPNLRSKVVTLLGHINKRLKSRSSIKIPVLDLLKMYNNHNVSSFVSNFSMIYINMGFKRLSPDEKRKVAPFLFESIKGKQSSQQDTLLRMVCETFSLINFNDKDNKSYVEQFNFKENKVQLLMLLNFFQDVIIMPYSSSLKSFNQECPGLSRNAVKRLLGEVEEDHWSFETIEKIKIAILNFVKKEYLDINKFIVHLIIASSDTKSTVADNSDLQLRNALTAIKWNDFTLATNLYKVYLGSAADFKNKNIASDEKVPPASIRVKIKIMQHMQRCTVATEQMPHNIQVVYDGLFGESSDKLKTLALQFMHYIFDSSSVESLKKSSPMLINAATKVVLNDENVGMNQSRIKSLGFVSFSKIATRLPQVFSKKFDLVQKFLQALAKESSTDVKQSIVDATTSMIPAFKNQSNETIESARHIISKTVFSTDYYTKIVGVRYAANMFASGDVQSRYLLLLSTADLKEDVASEALSLLKSDLKQEPIKLPSFQLILDHVVKMSEERINTRLAYTIGMQQLAFHPTAFTNIIRYIFTCFLSQSSQSFDEELSSFNSELPLEFLSSFVKDKIKNDKELCEKNMNKLVRLMIDYVSLIPDSFVLNLLLETVGRVCHLVSIDKLFENTDKRSSMSYKLEKVKVMEWAENLSFHNREELSYLGAELYSILFANDNPTTEKYMNMFRKNHKKITDQAQDQQLGSIFILSHLLGTFFCHCSKGHFSVSEDDSLFALDLLCTIGEIAVTSTNQDLISASCYAIGEIARKAPLPLPDGNLEKSDDFTRPTSKLHLCQLLSKRLSSKNTHRVRQRAAVSLGRLPVGDVNFPHTDTVMNALLDTAEETKELEPHFIIGEALVMCASGCASNEALNKWTDDSEFISEKPRNNDRHDQISTKLEQLLTKVLTEFVDHRKPLVRQVSCIWLVKFLSSDEYAELGNLEKYFVRLQNAFTSLISESNELVQDLASKGLCMVYERGDVMTKSKLVNELVSNLTGSGANTSNVRIMGDESRKFFSKTDKKKVEGPALMLYKDLCSLASDLKHPELAYKFLYLQNNRLATNDKKSRDITIKNSYKRKKHLFNHDDLVKGMKEQLKPLHKQLVPRLFRCTFDPQPNVRVAMTNIWNVVCPQPNKYISIHLDLIVDELMRGMTHMLWRVRQSSCMAFVDIFRIGIMLQVDTKENTGRITSIKGNPILDNLPLIWSTAFKVQDDMKESVRESAHKLCRALEKLFLKLVDPKQSSKINEEVLTKVIDVLLNEGMLSKVQETRAVSMKTLVEVSKVSGELIRPCISALVISLLEVLSDTEPPEINYFRNRSEQCTQDKLDRIRLEFVKSTPMMETAIRCVKFYNEQVLKELIPQVIELTKRGVGVPTKGGCAYFTTQLVSICGQDLSPFAAKLIRVFVSGLKDKSLAIRKTNASTVGTLFKIAKNSTIEKNIEKFKDWYFNGEEDGSRHSSASAIYAIARHAPDIMSKFLEKVLPLAYYAMHEPQDAKIQDATSTKGDDQSFEMTSKQMFQAVWTEFTPGTETAVKLYLEEIVNLSSHSLQSQNWQLKGQAAQTMSSLAQHHSSKTISLTSLKKLVEALLMGLKGRYWVGKNNLVIALKDLLKHHHSDFDNDQAEKVLNSLLNEAVRSNKATYKCEAIACYGLSSVYLNIDNFNEFWTVAAPFIKPKANEDSDDEKSDKKQKAEEELSRKTMESCDEQWKVASAQTLSEQSEPYVCLIIELYTRVSYQTRIACLTSIDKLVLTIGENLKKFDKTQLSNVSSIPEALKEFLMQCIGDVKFSLIRQKSSAVVAKLCQLSDDGVNFFSVDSIEVLSRHLSNQISICKELNSSLENTEALKSMETAFNNLQSI